MSGVNPTKPVSIEKWIEENSKFFVPPVCNKLLYGEGQLKAMFVGGPNTRKDYHIELGEELFYQNKGDMVLPIFEHGKPRDIHIKEGEIFVIQSRIPHSPQRFKDTVGLVIERERLPTELDALRYYVPSQPTETLYQECFHCEDLGVQLKPVIERYFASEQYKTGFPLSGQPDPSVPGQHVLPYPIDTESNIMEPFSLAKWISDREEKLLNGNGVVERMFGGGERDEFQVTVHGPIDGEGEKTVIEHEVLFWQWKGSCTVTTDAGEEHVVNEGDYFLIKPNVAHQTKRPKGSIGIVIYMIPRIYSP